MKLIKFILIFLSLNVYTQSDVPDEFDGNDQDGTEFFHKVIP